MSSAGKLRGNRSEVITFRFSKEEKDLFEKDIKRSGLNQSDYIRMKLGFNDISGAFDPDEMAKLLFQKPPGLNTSP